MPLALSANGNRRLRLKFKVLSALLIASVIANIVFITLYANSAKRVKHLKRDRQRLEQSAARVTGAIESKRASVQLDKRPTFYRRDFVSKIDGKQGEYALAPPQKPKKDCTLVIYFHGMGSSYAEPFVRTAGYSISDTAQQLDSSTVFASLEYRESDWENPAFLADIDQNIGELLCAYPISKIVASGSSMGACVAALYACKAPTDIRDKIRGVVFVEGADDMEKLFAETKSDYVRMGLVQAFGGTPNTHQNVYRNASIAHNLDSLPRPIKFAIVSAKQDTTVPPVQQTRLSEELSSRGVPSLLLEIEAAHSIPASRIYRQAYDFTFR